VSDDLMTAAFTPFYIRRKVEGETLAEFVKRIRANPPAGPLFEDQEPSHRGPGRRDRRRLCTWCHQPFEYSGKFWTERAPWNVTGVDLNPERARNVCADFTCLPFRDGAFDVAIFDPPYLTDASSSGLMAMDRQFSSFRSVGDARRIVSRGATEAWRAGRIGCIVKVQNYTHASRSVRMTRWVEAAIPEEPYGEVHALTPSKIFDPKWGRQLSVYSVHTTYLAFRHGSQMHRRRKPAVLATLTAAEAILAEHQPPVQLELVAS
jgi:hypothetical protein